ncbi:phospholipase d delta [Phtheirospermum japonicum]|uniref:Phospholipase D n=1 Tax=Phtheirospermum japonicum TaxID=374723 RepID=A0A830B558_9LAMI|nr:phospholipase d delta [Phtheirospermum japonicum]
MWRLTYLDLVPITHRLLLRRRLFSKLSAQTHREMVGTYYLHGDLDLRIVEARDLPDIRTLSKRLFHPYILVRLGAVQLARTRASATSDLQNPVWDQRFTIPLAHPVPEITKYLVFKVINNRILHTKRIGMALVPLNQIISGQPIDEWFPVHLENHDASIRLQITFKPCRSNPILLEGISDNYETRGSYFPLRRGGDVTLYQDAHAGKEGTLPVVQLDGGRMFQNEQCWQDMCSAIERAKRLIYVTGWSVYVKTKLVREPTTRPVPGGSETLGELLKKKASEGVKVVLLVWDDPSSVKQKLYKLQEGLMKTHDEQTRKFFEDSLVNCLLVPRLERSVLVPRLARCVLAPHLAHYVVYTHHQKCVIVDTEDHGDNRKITAFLGGLDLCDGRYDTPEHRLYRDKHTVFANDYSNPSLKKGENGPRQPWHDLHCKIEGQGAYDVLKNFEQRWLKAINSCKVRKLYKRLKGMHLEDALVEIEKDPLIASPFTTVSNDHHKQWHVQIFRSIDSESQEGFPIDLHLIEEQNKLVIDRSIQMAYVHAIRSAQHFIYIENQYFIGSSFAWPSHRDAGADNLIPIELALKIASKIKARERFAVYIVIPMWPEGDSNSLTIQNILYWQRLTMQMMYKIVAEEIKSTGLVDAHPTDYLNFYCLGNREDYDQTSSIEHDSASAKFRRFMVYVHSKGMIVDDAYILLGSANINERSMEGSRDTEIAMGAYQPHHTWPKKKEHPRGQVYGYRNSLWAEHIGRIEDCFKDPESLECVKYVNGVAEDNWKRYTADEFTRPLQGHILKYPMEVDVDGNVKPLAGHESFPDVGGVVEGLSALFITGFIFGVLSSDVHSSRSESWIERVLVSDTETSSYDPNCGEQEVSSNPMAGEAQTAVVEQAGPSGMAFPAPPTDVVNLDNRGDQKTEITDRTEPKSRFG